VLSALVKLLLFWTKSLRTIVEMHFGFCFSQLLSAAFRADEIVGIQTVITWTAKLQQVYAVRCVQKLPAKNMDKTYRKRVS